MWLLLEWKLKSWNTNYTIALYTPINYASTYYLIGPPVNMALIFTP